jgi:hypothetical protein
VRIWFGSLSGRTSVNYINSGNLAISSDLFSALGGFDDSLVSGEDVDLCRRALQLGAEVYELQRMNAIHLGYPFTLAAFYRRERWHGREMLRRSGSWYKNRALIIAIEAGVALVAAATAAVLSLPLVAIAIVIGHCLFLCTLASYRVRGAPIQDILRLALLYGVYGLARFQSVIESLFWRVRRKFP